MGEVKFNNLFIEKIKGRAGFQITFYENKKISSIMNAEAIFINSKNCKIIPLLTEEREKNKELRGYG